MIEIRAVDLFQTVLGWWRHNVGGASAKCGLLIGYCPRTFIIFLLIWSNTAVRFFFRWGSSLGFNSRATVIPVRFWAGMYPWIFWKIPRFPGLILHYIISLILPINIFINIFLWILFFIIFPWFQRFIFLHK